MSGKGRRSLPIQSERRGDVSRTHLNVSWRQIGCETKVRQDRWSNSKLNYDS